MAQQTIEGFNAYQEVKEHGFALIEQNIPPDLIDSLIADYAVFTDNFPDPKPETMNAMIVDPNDLDNLNRIADTQNEWHKYRTNQPHYAKPNGYTNRSFQASVLRQFDRRILDSKTGEMVEAHEDPKEYFHYAPGHRQAMERAHDEYGWGSIPSEVSVLLTRFHTIHGLAKAAMGSFYGKIEETHPELVRFVRPQDMEISPVRLLFYHPGQGDVLAGGHYDRGLGTLQIAESHQGLRTRNPRTGEMDMVQRDPRMGVAFPALKWTDGLPDSEIQPLWHDVIDSDVPNEGRNLHGRNVARWSLIFFTNSEELGEKSIKTRTHTE